MICSSFAYCYPYVNVFIFSLSQSDHIKRHSTVIIICLPNKSLLCVHPYLFNLLNLFNFVFCFICTFVSFTPVFYLWNFYIFTLVFLAHFFCLFLCLCFRWSICSFIHLYLSLFVHEFYLYIGSFVHGVICYDV